jgi:acetyltransferase-like isoleucine patch superfamily enzyme
MKKMLFKIYNYYCRVVVSIFYPQKKELALWNAIATKKYIFWQKILNINGARKIPWPVHFTSKVGGNIKTGYLTTPGMMPGIYINGMNGVFFGDNVYIGAGVKIISANHDIYDYSKHVKSEPIVIGNNVWIGSNAVILPAVTIADGCVIGAGSVVTRSFVEKNCIIAGNPAKIVNRKNEKNSEK